VVTAEFLVMKMKLKTSEPEVPKLVARMLARAKLAPPAPRVNGGPPQPNQAAIDALKPGTSVEEVIMNQRDPWGAQSSEKNRQSQGGPLADLNNDLTFARAGSRYSHTDYMKSRRIGG
jgi:hypothetical protein